MKITDEAKKLVQNVLDEDQKNTLRVEILREGNGAQLFLDTYDSDETNTINGIKVTISDEDAAILENVVLDVKNGGLIFFIEGQGCCGGGCHGGCSSDCDSGCECDGDSCCCSNN